MSNNEIVQKINQMQEQISQIYCEVNNLSKAFHILVQESYKFEFEELNDKLNCLLKKIDCDFKEFKELKNEGKKTDVERILG